MICVRIKRLSFWLIAVLTALSVSVSASLLPIPDMPTQTVSGYRQSGPYGWTYAFDIGFSSYELYVDMKIGFSWDGIEPGAGLRSVWEEGIEEMWQLKYDIIDGDFHYHVNFNTVFSAGLINPSGLEKNDYHHIVEVRQGQGGGDMLNWYEVCDWGAQYNDEFAAHEVGHMFSLYDEYTGGAVDPINPIIDSSSIMGSLAGSVKERHYEPFLNWLQANSSGRELTIGEYDPDWQIPEPSTLLIISSGMIAISRKRRLNN